MQLLIKDRQAGKTTQLLYTSEATRCPIVVPTKIRIQYLLQMAEMLNLNIPQPLTISELIKNKRGVIDKPCEILIDEGYDIIEDALNAYTGCCVKAVTFTDPLKENKSDKNNRNHTSVENYICKKEGMEYKHANDNNV